MRRKRAGFALTTARMLVLLAPVGCGRVNEPQGNELTDTRSSTDSSAEGTPVDGTADGVVDTGRRSDGCPTTYIVLDCAEKELGKVCVYDNCGSGPVTDIYTIVCVKNTGDRPPYPYGWSVSSVPCPRDAGKD